MRKYDITEEKYLRAARFREEIVIER